LIHGNKKLEEGYSPILRKFTILKNTKGRKGGDLLKRTRKPPWIVPPRGWWRNRVELVLKRGESREEAQLSRGKRDSPHFKMKKRGKPRDGLYSPNGKGARLF